MPATREDVERLRRLVEAHSFEFGQDFRLSSGAHSSYYYDGKRTTLRPSAARLVGSILLPIILDSGAEAVGGLEIGAVPISSAVGHAALDENHDLPIFIVRKERKAHGTRDEIAESYADDGPLLRPGRKVAIVDDVITLGGSVLKAIRAVKERGCEVVAVIALVERHEGGGAELRSQGYNVMRVFYSSEAGDLFIDEDFVRRLERVSPPVGAPSS